jgi:hypothetical protein
MVGTMVIVRALDIQHVDLRVLAQLIRPCCTDTMVTGLFVILSAEPPPSPPEELPFISERPTVPLPPSFVDTPA